MKTPLLDKFNMLYADKSKNTMANYTKSILDFYQFMQEKFNCQTEDEIIKSTDWLQAQTFRNSLIDKGLNPKTINNTLSGLRSYFKFLILAREIEVNPFRDIEQVSTKSVEEYERPYLEESEFEVLINTIKSQDAVKRQQNFDLTSTRDALAVGIMLKAGLRVSELLSIKENDIDEETGIVSVLGKGNKRRNVKIGQDNIQRLREYKYVRKAYTQSDYLFVNRYGNQITRQALNKNLKSYLDRAGLNMEISAHGLRASCATSHLRNGVRVTQVAKLLGHSDIKTTLKHYAKESDEFDFID